MQYLTGTVHQTVPVNRKAEKPPEFIDGEGQAIEEARRQDITIVNWRRQLRLVVYSIRLKKTLV